MPFIVKTNRIQELRDNLSLLVDSQRKSRLMQPAAKTAANVMLVEMMRRAPVGRVEPNYSVQTSAGFTTISHGFPSIRQHGMRLSQGWLEPTTITNPDGVSFRIQSRAPHMGILLAGAPEHRIPVSGNALLSFWHFNSPERFKAAIAAYVPVHPGFVSRAAFVRESFAVKRIFMLAKFREGAAAVLAPLRMFFEK